MRWIRLTMARLWWTLHPIRRPILVWVPERQRSEDVTDWTIMQRAQKAVKLGASEATVRRILFHHLRPQHAYRTLMRMADETVLEQGRKAWAEHLEQRRASASEKGTSNLPAA